MAVNEPIDPLVRLAISQWPDDAPRGAVSTFCAEHGISRKSFYELRKRAKTDGPAAVLEPRTRRPKSSPSQLSDGVKEQAVAVRAALEAPGAGTHVRTVSTSGTIRLDKVIYKVDAHRAFEQVLVVTTNETIIIADLQGEILAEHTRPAPGINYVGNGRPSGPRPKTRRPSPKS